MNNDDRSFTTAPAPAPAPTWSNEEDEILMTVVYPPGIEVCNLFFPGKTTDEHAARINALNAVAAEEALWSKDEVDLLWKLILNWSLENEIEWWMNLYSCFPTKTQDQVVNKYRTLLNEITAAMPDTEPNRIELIPNIVSDQTLLPLPFSDTNSDDYSYGYGIQNLKTESATVADVVLPVPQPGADSNACGSCYGNQNLNIQTATEANVVLPEPELEHGMMENTMNSALPLALPMSNCDNSNSYGNLNTTAGGYFPMDTNQQSQVIQPYDCYYGKENHKPNPNPNYVVNQRLPFTAVENPNPYFIPTVNYENNHDTNNLVSFPAISNPNPNPNLNVDGFLCNQVTHPNLNMGYFTSFPFTNQSSSLPSQVTKASSSVLRPLTYNYQSPNMVSNCNNLLRKMKKADRGCYWSVAEHREFLSGVAQHGWGDWRSISRKCLRTKNPAQIASHAQKYQLRHYGPNTATKKRKSIHDITLSSENIKVLPPRLLQN